MFKQFILCGMLSIVSLCAAASPIYTDIVGEDYWYSNDLQLYFMDLSVVQDKSYNDIIGMTSVGGQFEGWRLASNVESTSLYDLFSSGSAVDGWSVDHYDNALSWFRLNGYRSADATDWDIATQTPLGHMYWLQIYDETLQGAHIAIDESVGWFYHGQYDFNGYSTAPDESTGRAPLLTRSAIVSVPEPSTIFILLIGMLTLSLVNRKKMIK